MFDPAFLRSPVESSVATDFQLYFGFTMLILTFISISFQLIRLIVKVKRNYKLSQKPFTYVITIFTGLLLVIFNELIILYAIIYSGQVYTYLGRENSVFIVMGLGLFIYGWTQVLLFNLKLKKSVRNIIGFAFLGAMIFYIFAFIITILITFQILDIHVFLGLGYPLAVAIYGSFLLVDLFVMVFVASSKRKISKYQGWIGILLFSALFLNFLSIVFNAIPLIIVNRVDPYVHAIFNYIVEPATYFITDTFSLLLLTWVLFNPKWLHERSIEEGT